jgi:hypothetical protein
MKTYLNIGLISLLLNRFLNSCNFPDKSDSKTTIQNQKDSIVKDIPPNKQTAVFKKILKEYDVLTGLSSLEQGMNGKEFRIWNTDSRSHITARTNNRN